MEVEKLHCLKVSECSKGMNEKLQLSLVLSRNAKLYVLDEPIAGVDPVAREKILDAIVEFYNKESSMLITTHLLTDIERIFDDVAFIKDGQIIIYDNAEHLRIEHNWVALGFYTILLPHGGFWEGYRCSFVD